MCSAQVFWRQIRTSLNEAFDVERYAVIKPTGIRVSTGHDENTTDVFINPEARPSSPLLVPISAAILSET